jgi:coatomer subunit beta'
MPLRLEIKKELTARSDRVKSVDIYPSEKPWVLAALYSGNVFIWDYTNNTVIKSFEMGSNPVRCAKFIVRKSWIIAGTDDMQLRVYNYNTMDKVKEWEAHNDYIRFVEIHPNRPYILSSSDDMSIKLWDWEKDFECIQVFEGHAHYVMMVKLNPRDTNTFATASLDKTIKVWVLTANVPHFSLDGPGAHEKGVNCIDYYPGGDKPYLLSGADDRTVKIWDYQTKACLQTLDGHQHNVSAVCFHPRLPLIISASEDGTVRLWHSTTYRPETTLNYGLERAWAVAVMKDANKIAIGYDEGTIVLKLGNEKPVASLDTNTGKLVWAKGHDIQTMSVKGLSKAADTEIVDGEAVQLNARDLGSCEVYPQSLQHNSNGSFICVCGDGEYIIYTSQALRNKAFGTALDFVWSASGTGDYAVRESISRVRIFKNFKDHKQLTLPMSSAEGIYGGTCLAVKGTDSIVFFDWEEGTFIRKIDVAPLALYWSQEGDNLVVVCDDCFYVLKYDRDVVASAIQAGGHETTAVPQIW